MTSFIKFLSYFNRKLLILIQLNQIEQIRFHDAIQLAIDCVGTNFIAFFFSFDKKFSLPVELEYKHKQLQDRNTTIMNIKKKNNNKRKKKTSEKIRGK